MKNSGGSNGTDSADSSGKSETQNQPAGDGDSAQDAENGNTSLLSNAPYKVTVQLNEPLAIPLASVIQIQDKEYLLVAAPESESNQDKS